MRLSASRVKLDDCLVIAGTSRKVTSVRHSEDLALIGLGGRRRMRVPFDDVLDVLPDPRSRLYLASRTSDGAARLLLEEEARLVANAIAWPFIVTPLAPGSITNLP